MSNIESIFRELRVYGTDETTFQPYYIELKQPTIESGQPEREGSVTTTDVYVYDESILIGTFIFKRHDPHTCPNCAYKSGKTTVQFISEPHVVKALVIPVAFAVANSSPFLTPGNTSWTFA
jgi:hypothetical protein